MITSLINKENRELPNLGHNTTSKSHGKILLVTSLTKRMTSISFQNIFILRMARVANFADIIKIAIIFIKRTFKDSKKVKRIRNYELSGIYICIS